MEVLARQSRRRPHCPEPCGRKLRRLESRPTRFKTVIRFRLYECAAGHVVETAESVLHVGQKGEPHKFINTHTIRASETRWRQMMGYRK